MIQGSSKGTSTRQDERPKCLYYHKNIMVLADEKMGVFFICGSTDHLIANCPQGFRSSRNPQGSSRGDGREIKPLK